MLLKGLQKLTLLDYPGKMAATVFVGGCNFKCPFCHNASLVLGERVSESATLPEEEFFAFLNKRKNILEGVCVSGGEPTLHPDLPDLLREIKARGFDVKLDTNGTNPEMLSRLIDEGLVDYVAMDVKNSPERYGETAGLSSRFKVQGSKFKVQSSWFLVLCSLSCFHLAITSNISQSQEDTSESTFLKRNMSSSTL